MPTPSSNTHNFLLTVPCSHFIYWFHCGKYPSSIYPSSPTRLKTRFFPQAGHTGCSIFLSYSFLSKKSYIFSESCPSAGYSCLLQPSAHRQNRYPPQGVTILSFESFGRKGKRRDRGNRRENRSRREICKKFGIISNISCGSGSQWSGKRRSNKRNRRDEGNRKELIISGSMIV